MGVECFDNVAAQQTYSIWVSVMVVVLCVPVSNRAHVVFDHGLKHLIRLFNQVFQPDFELDKIYMGAGGPDWVTW